MGSSVRCVATKGDMTERETRFLLAIAALAALIWLNIAGDPQ
jgi:hypothetical protein